MLTQDQITQAHHRIAGRVRRTPVLRLGARELGLPFPVTLKLEQLQHSGSFKARGAFNRILQTSPGAAGVIAASGGNHGAAVAYAAQQLGLKAEIFVPETAPSAKCDRIAAYGAEVILRGRNYAEALQACEERQRASGALNVHAYDQIEVLAGQGTLGLELAEQAPELTHILVAVGGGGLIGGIAGWYAGKTEIVAVEPEHCPALNAALAAGHPVPVDVSGIAADSLGARQVGALMFAVAQRYSLQSILVSDAAIRSAQSALWQAARMVTEPGGAAALAALLSGHWQPPAGARVGVVVCGGNVDPSTVA